MRMRKDAKLLKARKGWVRSCIAEGRSVVEELEFQPPRSSGPGPRDG